MARWDNRKVKTIIQDYNRTFLGSQQFLKYKPGALESYTILLRHRGFLNKFLLQGTQGHHRLNMDQFLRGGYESSPPGGSPLSRSIQLEEKTPFYKYHHSCCVHHYIPPGIMAL